MRKITIIQEDDGSLTTIVKMEFAGEIRKIGYRAICDIAPDLMEYFGMEE